MPPRVTRLNPPIPALHPERDALLAAVRDAHPDDDLPALVYADWQDEHGQPEHAELIRVMVELRKLPPRASATKARHAELSHRVNHLFRTPALQPLWVVCDRGRAVHGRGFDRALCVHWTEAYAGGGFVSRQMAGPSNPDLPSVFPFDKVAWLGVQLGHDEDDRPDHLAAALAGSLWLRRSDRLCLPDYGGWYWVGPEAFTPLAASPNLGGVRTFQLHQHSIAGDALVRLYAAKSAVNLQVLELGQLQHGVTPRSSRRPSRKAFLSAVERIVSAKRASQFTSFGDEMVDVDEALAKILLASPHLKNVRQFRYTFGKATAKTQAAFVERFGKPERV